MRDDCSTKASFGARSKASRAEEAESFLESTLLPSRSMPREFVDEGRAR